MWKADYYNYKIENTKIDVFFFSFIEEKKKQKEELFGRPESFATCGWRPRTLSLEPASL